MRGGRGKGGERERQAAKEKIHVTAQKIKFPPLGRCQPVEMNSMNTHMKITITGMDKFYIRI